MADGSSLPHAGSLTFDLQSQSGITELLLAVRKSDLTTAQKNDLRDVVLLYTNGGRDETVRIALEQKIKTFGIVALPKDKPTPQTPPVVRPVIGTFRSSPQFQVPPVTVVSPIPDVVPPPTVPEITPAAMPVTPVEPVPVVVASVPVEQPEPVVIEPTPEPLPVSVKVPSVSGQEQYLDRIREIKALVNQKVGNPVNLVDIDNAVGREYMSALLDAMKRINSGASADEAMRRLEAAVVAVFAVIEKHSGKSESAPMAQSPEPVVRELYSEPAPVAEPVTVPVRSYEPEPQPNAAVPETFTPLSTPVVPVPSYTAPAPAENTAPVTQTVYPQKFSSLADVLVAPTTPIATPSPAMQTMPMRTAAVPQSNDPLFAPDVEDGLAQLLSEWSIFKKSGIFGTGPKGREHPLYKKMAELQIPLLLAGRFEGATQEVRQSLTDYMNGWRYEQGIIYERGETFEHYLRRVIRHILDLQKV